MIHAPELCHSHSHTTAFHVPVSVIIYPLPVQTQTSGSPGEIAYLHSPDAPEISKHAEKKKSLDTCPAFPDIPETFSVLKLNIAGSGQENQGLSPLALPPLH